MTISTYSAEEDKTILEHNYGVSYQEIGESLGRTPDQVRSRYRRLTLQGISLSNIEQYHRDNVVSYYDKDGNKTSSKTHKKENDENVDILGDNPNSEYVGSRTGDPKSHKHVSAVVYCPNKEAIKTPEELIIACGLTYNAAKWKIDDYKITSKTREVTARTQQVSENPKMPDWQRTIESVQGYGVEIKFKRRESTDPVAVRDAIVNELKNFSPVFKKQKYKKGHGKEQMVEISFADVHLGKYAYIKETGENYDIEIARAAIYHVVDTAMDYIRDHCTNPQKICLVLGNDMLHADNEENETTRGTRQDVDTRYKKIALEARKIFRDVIFKFTKFAPVHVVVVPGNHDSLGAFHIGSALECTFENNPNVTIDNGEHPRKYYRWKEILLGFTHGHRKSEVKSLYEIMSLEAAEHWKDTKTKEWHTGHIHTQTSKSSQGVRVDPRNPYQEHHGMIYRTLASIAGIDSWHADNGYIGNVHGCDFFLWTEGQKTPFHKICEVPENVYLGIKATKGDNKNAYIPQYPVVYQD